MSTVTRYDCITGVEGGPEMDPFGLGNWVAFDDYEKLEAELAEMNELQEALSVKLQQFQKLYWDGEQQLAELKIENDRLQEKG